MFLENVFRTLNKYRVNYLVVGGVASVLYGNPRFTKDLDILVDSKTKNLKKLIKAFSDLKFVPRVPVKPEEFISEENRRKWKEEKGMLAFTFINPRKAFEVVDILTESPFPFKKAYGRKTFFALGTIRVPTIGREDLIHMKQKAGRIQDLQDIEILKAVRFSERQSNAKQTKK